MKILLGSRPQPSSPRREMLKTTVKVTLQPTFVAVLSFVVIRALTVIVANSVNTGASVLTRFVNSALVHI